ncbi:hypothetical protein ACP4OV_015950 [Aristida adscensionis]
MITARKRVGGFKLRRSLSLARISVIGDNSFYATAKLRYPLK